MAAEVKKEIQLEIAHVLFIDIVGYSKLPIDEQRDCLHTLNEAVRATDSFRTSDTAGKLTTLPTGDGMALVFATTPDAPVVCALQIAKALQSHPDLRVRMGIHSGPVSGIVDVNQRSNIAGAGINMAQRVMDCGDAGHILLSKRVADDLEQYRQWRPHLHDLGECEVKHGVRVLVVNLYTDELGNPAVPMKLQQESEKRASAVPSAPRRKATLMGGVVLVALVLAFALSLLWRQPTPHVPLTATNQSPSAVAPQPQASVLNKRIAVLPFKPLVPENRDQVLEIGMADTLITKLSNSREIIVTSLTSVRKYGGLDQDPIAAGRELRVNSILEGNVQRSGDHIRVTARLISVADGASLWASTFDEKFTDVFTVQEAISRKVADALALSLSGEEKKRLAKRETQNVGAYQLYLTGRYH